VAWKGLFLQREEKLIMEANASLETITQKHGDGYRKGQEPMEKLYDKYEEQLESLFQSWRELCRTSS